MNKAEERARAFYLPIVMVLGNPDGLYQEECFARDCKIKGFVDGYEQAEKDFMEKAILWFREHANIPYKVETNENGEPLADSYIDYCKKRLEAGNEMFEAFKAFVES